MAPPALTPTIRYYPPGIRKVYWMPACANYNNPTRAELDAGVDLTNELSAMTGWSLTSAVVDTPDLGHRFTSEVPGALSSSNNDITFYTSQNSDDIRQLLPRATVGYIVVLWEGDVTGQYMDVFPVQVMANAMQSTTTDAGTVAVSFAISSQPAIDVSIP
jgi:hypothetical protein